MERCISANLTRFVKQGVDRMGYPLIKLSVGVMLVILRAQVLPLLWKASEEIKTHR